MKKISILSFILIVLVAGFYIIFKGDLDRFNPFYEGESVYVMINKPSEPDNARFKYNLTGYNEQGKKRRVVFTSSTDLNQGIYLKLKAKGAYTENWEIITEEDIPSDVQTSLK